jgi:hypothetical protein
MHVLCFTNCGIQVHEAFLPLQFSSANCFPVSCTHNRAIVNNESICMKTKQVESQELFFSCDKQSWSLGIANQDSGLFKFQHTTANPPCWNPYTHSA